MLTRGTLYGTLRTLLRKISQSQRDTHHDSPDSRVPFPPQGRQEDCCKFKAGQGYTGEMVQNYKTDNNNNNIMVGTEIGGSMVAPGCKEWDWDLLTYCPTHPEWQLCKLKRFWR